jgi:putative membrane protein
MGPWMMGSFGWGWFMPIVMIVFWGLVICGIVVLVRYITQSTVSRQADSALEILKVRYAKGDINQAEYEEKKKDLI